LICCGFVAQQAVQQNPQQIKPGIEQALADISRSALCCNETRAPIANPPNSAQLEGTPTIPPTYVWVRAVVWECGDDRQTDTQTHRPP